jgi:hypothetical protein
MKKLCSLTALLELGAGAALLAAPSLAVKLLLGSPLDSPAAVVLGRLAGAALFTLGLACWFARGDGQSRTARGLVLALLFYNVAVVVILAIAGISAKLVGVLLWPAVGLHILLAGWCILSLRNQPSGRLMGTPRMKHH